MLFLIKLLLPLESESWAKSEKEMILGENIKRLLNI